MAQEYNFEPPERLYGNILIRIEREKIRAARIRFAVLGTTALASTLALIPAYQYAASEFTQSGFLQYLSVVFSDSSIAAVYWKEFALTLAESAPVLGATILLSVIFALLGSFALTIKNARRAFLSVQHI